MKFFTMAKPSDLFSGEELYKHKCCSLCLHHKVVNDGVFMEEKEIISSVTIEYSLHWYCSAECYYRDMEYMRIDGGQ